MKNKIHRIGQFIDRHNNAYYWTCGLITGACTVYVAMHTTHKTDMLKLTVDQVKELAKDEELHALFELPKQTIALKIVP